MKKQPKHLLYAHLDDAGLRDLIKEVGATRKKVNAGRDLIEMRREYMRRVEERRLKMAEKKSKKLPEGQRVKMLENAQQKYQNFAKNTLPSGLSAMQEKFCLEYTATGDVLAAYRSAGYKDLNNDAKTRAEAKRLLKNDKIEERCNQIRLDAMKDVSVNINEVVKKFMDVYNRGLADNDLTNANRAMEFIGKHLGMLIERQEIKQDITSKSPEELEREIKHYENVVKLENINKK